MGYVDTSGHILGQQEARMAASNVPTHKDKMDQDDFMTILVAQLTHQDPLNPMEDTEMTSQLAEFSSLEQLTNINKGIGNLSSSQQRSDMMSAVSYIGKSVRAEGYNVSIEGDKVSSIYYGFGEPVSSMIMNIYGSDGDIVRTVDLGSKQAGSYQFDWDGKNEAGQTMPDGMYSVGILGKDVEGGNVLVKTEISGVVDGVVSEGGTNYLRLKDGRYLNFLNVNEVVDGGSELTGTETEDETANAA